MKTDKLKKIDSLINSMKACIMQKLTRTINAIVLSTLLLNATSIHSMEIDYKEQALQAEKYNQSNPNFIKFFEDLLTLPDDCLQQTFYSNLQSTPYTCGPNFHVCSNDLNARWIRAQHLANKIKDFIRLKTVCKQITNILTPEKIGSFYKDYEQETKDRALRVLARNDWPHVRLPALILICAGANDQTTMWGNDDPHGHKFFYYAVLQNDAQFIEALFKNGAKSNVTIFRKPLFYSARTKEVAQLFIDYKADIHATFFHHFSGEQNVLWEALTKKYPSELMELYLQHKVDATLRTHSNSLLHEIGKNIIHFLLDINDILKKAQLLLKAIPAMINVINKEGQTPLDIAQKILNTRFIKYQDNEWIEYTDPEVTKAAEKLIMLFREYGALTAQELDKQAQIIS